MTLPSSNRLFSSEPQQRQVAAQLYAQVSSLPIISPHGHVDARVLADPNYSFGTPADLFIIPDHYILRMLYSQGIGLEQLGLPRRDGLPHEIDTRQIWQRFADNYYLFRGTPVGIWTTAELREIFGVEEKLDSASAQRIYDQVADKLAQPAYRPRALFERFNIEVLCTTDAATDTLDDHEAIRASGWKGVVRPTFRPDAVINFGADRWRVNITRLGEMSGVDIRSYTTYIQALEQRRTYFKRMGATATDHGAPTAFTQSLSESQAATLFQRALRGEASSVDEAQFTGHMLIEMARMSVEDGLVMQLHPGAVRSHNDWQLEQFGPDKGADIPQTVEFTHNLKPLLDRFGNDPRLTLIAFTLDETTYSRELAPLASHYPALKLGPPWWFYDSLNGIERYLDQVMETAGLYNTVGFNDDTRAFCSIPARHELWRRATANWVAGLVVREIVDLDEAGEMVQALAYGLAKKAYRL
jgi:glucuronate isomerase